VLEKLGTFGTVVGVGAAGLAAFAVAGWEAAKSLGQYGVMIKDAELRTGLTAKEVGQFGFAARAVGQDVSIFERMMRGLTGAVEATGTEGEKARQWLTRFGVDLQGVRTGTVSTSEVMLQVARGLDSLPPGFDRSRVAMDLFKRVGIEAIPVMEGLNDRVNRAKQLGFGPSEDDVKKYERLNQQAVEFEVKWESAIRSVKGMLVDLAGAFGWVLDKISTPPSIPLGQSESRSEHRAHADRIKALQAQGPAALQAQINSLQQQTNQYSPGVGNFIKGTLAQMVGQIYIPSGPDAQKYGQAAVELKYAKEALEGLNKNQPHAPLPDDSGGSSRGDNGLSSAMRSARKELAGVGDDRFAVLAAERQEAINDALDKYKEKAGPLVELLKQVYDAKWVKEFNSESEKLNKELAQQEEHWTQLTLKAHKAQDSVFKDEIDQGIKKLEEEGKAVGRLAAEYNKLRSSGESQAFQHQKRMIQINGQPGDELGTLAQQQLLDYGQIAQRRQDALSNLSKDPAQAVFERANAEKTAANEVGQLRYAWEEKVTELRNKEAENEAATQKRQLDQLAHATSGLWNTLLTKPGQFGKQLGSTIYEAVIKPVAEGMSAVTATVLKPIIYGQDGQGGLSAVFKGAFGGKQDPMKMATDMNTAVTAQNSAALATLTAVLAGAMGMAAPAIAAPAGIGGISLPSISAPAVSGSTASTVAFGGGASSGSSFTDLTRGLNPVSMVFGGGTGTSAEIPTLNHAASGGGFNPLSMVLGGRGGASQSGSPGTGIAGMLKSFKGINWGGFTRAPGSNVVGWGADGTPHDDMGNPVKDNGDGRITGVNGAAGAAMGAGGMMLAQQGLLGSSRGTWGGVGMGTAGGAMIGYQQGGALGAAIGGAAGFMIGIGEKIAGVETPENEAKRLVKSLYFVNIDTAMAKQIVDLAKQKYAGHVSIAVRDPEVRKMLELYAQGTGQKMPLSATTPVGGSLAEQNGRLYQQASFVNGVATTFQSALPVMGNLGANNNYPTPGGPNTGPGMGPISLSLSVGGSDAASFLTGQVVTPTYVADASMAAQNASYGRVQASANTQVPGLITGT
jgi:hypothetical protein